MLTDWLTLLSAFQFQSFFNYKDETYKLLQFHFHTGSEHTLNGKQVILPSSFVFAAHFFPTFFQQVMSDC